MRLQCQFGQTLVLIVLVQGPDLSPRLGVELNVFSKYIIISILRTFFMEWLSCPKTCQKPPHQFPGEVQVERLAGRAVQNPIKARTSFGAEGAGAC